jgi:hypothetical protein
MPLSKPQQTIAESQKRFRVAVCGRRFGKTHLAIRELARFARQPNTLSWYISPTRSQGKGIVWEQLKDRLGTLNWIAKTNESELKITLVNGSEIQIMSADAYDRMRGYAVSGIAIFDEFADMDPDVWTAVRPTLSDRQGHALFIGTPKGGRSSWAYEIYSNGINSLDNWQSFSYTTLDGGNVPPEEIEAAKQDMPERMFRQEYLSTWEESAGQIYYAFSREHNVKSINNPDTSILHIGMDFNITPLCAVIAVKQGEDLYVIDEIALYSSNTHELADEIKSRYPKSKVWAYPDPAGRSLSTKSQGQSDHTILANAGFIVKAPRSHTPVRDRINAVNARLCSAAGIRHLFISPKCKYVIQCLERQVYKEGSNAIPEKGEFDHCNDALGYAIDWLWPITRERTPDPYAPKRWQHKIAA